MKKKNVTYVGSRPVFTDGRCPIEVGGYNLSTSQHFVEGDIITAGTLARRDEATRTVQIVKTAKVTAVDGVNVTLASSPFGGPNFCAGDKVLATISGTYADAPSIVEVKDTDSGYVVVLSAAISGLAEGNILQEVVASGSNAAIVKANCVVAVDMVVDNDDNMIDICVDTDRGAVYERRINAVPTAQKDATGVYLAQNSNIRFSQMQ